MVAKASSVEAAVRALREALPVDHVAFHLGRIVLTPIDAPFMRSTYPAEWTVRYLLRDYFRTDPVVLEGFSKESPFHWEDLKETPLLQQRFADARAIGISPTGYTIPVIDRNKHRSLLALCHSLPRRNFELLLEEVGEDLERSAKRLHHKAIRELYGEDATFPHLSPREIECLAYTARGKDCHTIASFLQLSEHTVRDYLKSVRHKLDSASIAQAVAKAIKLGILIPD